jgi:hypothetical protein
MNTYEKTKAIILITPTSRTQDLILNLINRNIHPIVIMLDETTREAQAVIPTAL